jgi:DNA mismatch endonuclease (patch repair protein)
VFGPARTAVFVDGCFWHGCPEHGRRRHEVNGWYWPAKIDRNRRRDRETDQLLAAAGWTVLRIWEHELTARGAEAAALRVRAALVDAVRQGKASVNFRRASRVGRSPG